MAISKWSSVEVGILSLFAVTNEISMQRAAAIASTFNGFSPLLGITDKSIRERFQGDRHNEAIQYWNQLSEYVRELSGDRNNMAHSPIVIHSAEEPDWDAPNSSAAVSVGPSPLLWLADSHKRTLTSAELCELELDFVHATNCIFQFSSMVTGKTPFPEKSAAQFERRRPPRSSRPENRFPKLPRQR